MTRCLHSEITRDDGPDITVGYSKRQTEEEENMKVCMSGIRQKGLVIYIMDTKDIFD